MVESTDDSLRTYYRDGVRWEAEIIKQANRSRMLAWFAAMVFAAVAILTLVAILFLLPLKSFEPYIVEVDKNTGYIEVKSGLTRPAKLTDQEAVTQANIVRYIRARESYDPYRIEENYALAQLLSAGEAAHHLEALYAVSNTSNPQRVYGTQVQVNVEIKSVTFPNDSTAMVRFSTVERRGQEATRYHFISVVRFRYTDAPIQNEWRFDNPLGFQVYQYQREQETTKTDVK